MKMLCPHCKDKLITEGDKYRVVKRCIDKDCQYQFTYTTKPYIPKGENQNYERDKRTGLSTMESIRRSKERMDRRSTRGLRR